jgi:hypothetical protein
MNKLIIALVLAASTFAIASEDRAPEVQLAFALPVRAVMVRPEIRLVADSAEALLQHVASVKPPQQIGTCYKVSEAGGCWSE